MIKIPIYTKDDPAFVRPNDPEFYLVAQNGLFLCRNHRFFQSNVRMWGDKSHFYTYNYTSEYSRKWQEEDTKKARVIHHLQPHEETATCKFPPLPQDLLELATGFFKKVHDQHHTEAIVLLFWNLKTKKYELRCPPQTVSWGSCKYEMTAPPPMCLQVGSVHSHGTMSAYSSFDDKEDERYLDGIHVVVGNIDRDPPDFHAVLAVDGKHFPQIPREVFEGYERRNPEFPPEWLEQLTVKTYTNTQYFGGAWGSWGGYTSEGTKKEKGGVLGRDDRDQGFLFS